MNIQESGCRTAPVPPCRRLRWSRTLAPLAVAALFSSVALAQVPPDIEAGIRKIGPIVDPACTADLYRPLMPVNDITSHVTPLYPGMTITRNQSFGPNPDDVVDIFVGDHGRASRPVLIYVPGGAGNKIEIQDKAANAFNDNVARWAVQHGMIGVLMQRHFSPGWDGGAKDVSSMIQWLQDHIAAYHGNPERMLIWAQSAGNGPLGTYIGRPELYGPKGVGVVGVIFMSGQFDIAPVKVPPAAGMNFREMMAQAGKSCGEPGGMTSSAGALPGAAPGTPGGPNEMPGFGGPGAARGGPGGRGRGGFAPPDEATLLAHSSLPALEQTHVRIMLADAEFDPGVKMSVHHGLSNFNYALDRALCRVGPEHCPTLLVEKGESHMSEVFSIDTSDQTVSGPVLRFIRATLAAQRTASDPH